MSALKKISKLDAHHRSVLSVLASILFFFIFKNYFSIPIIVTFSWDIFALVTLILGWISISNTEVNEIRLKAKSQDSSLTTIFTLVITASCISLLAVGYVLGSEKGNLSGSLSFPIFIAVVSVVFSWLLIHTLYSLRYAHIYYGDKNITNKNEIEGGLEFPNEKNPDYLDFAYFSFVIGMTCQVSDVQVISKRMRRLVLLHGILSFTFNTAILALFINIIAGLI